MAERPKPGYFAVIPADVRYDGQIPANAKLLYGEISALCNSSGICTAQDAYLAAPYGFTDRTIRGLLKALETGSYIHTEVVRDPETGQIVGREIYLASAFAAKILRDIPACDSAEASGKDFPLASGKSFPEYIKNNNIHNPPKPPQGGVRPSEPKKRRGEYRAQAETLPERFEGFWKFYRGVCPGGVNPGNRQDAIRAWDKIGPDDDLVTEMGRSLQRQSRSDNWQRGIGVPHASTWLNKHMWEDDWGQPAAEGGEAYQPGEEQAEWVN